VNLALHAATAVLVFGLVRCGRCGAAGTAGKNPAPRRRGLRWRWRGVGAAPVADGDGDQRNATHGGAGGVFLRGRRRFVFCGPVETERDGRGWPAAVARARRVMASKRSDGLGAAGGAAVASHVGGGEFRGGVAGAKSFLSRIGGDVGGARGVLAGRKAARGRRDSTQE